MRKIQEFVYWKHPAFQIYKKCTKEPATITAQQGHLRYLLKQLIFFRNSSTTCKECNPACSHYISLIDGQLTLTFGPTKRLEFSIESGLLSHLSFPVSKLLLLSFDLL